MHDLHELKEKLLKELEEYGGNAKFSKEDVETIKYMASAIDHICNIAEGEEEGYSGRYPYWMGGAYADGNGGNMGGTSNRSYRGSYARGRSYRRGYSREGYSRDGGMVEELRDLMEEAPDERTKQEFQRFIDKIERM
jgi:hypothetical protein